MKHVAAYMMLALAGNEQPTSADVTKVLGSVGIDADEEKLQRLMSLMEGKSLVEVVEAGSKKLSAVPSGGAAAPAAGGAAATGGAAAAAEEAAPAVESESEEEIGGGGLFGSDDDSDSD